MNVPHRYDCHIRFSDVDVYRHVNNVKYFEYFQEARIAFITALGRDVTDSGLRQVVAQIDVDYKRPLLFRPEPYVVETWVTDVGRSSYALKARIVDGEPGSASYSEAAVRMVAFDMETQRSRPLNDEERAALTDAAERASGLG